MEAIGEPESSVSSVLPGKFLIKKGFRVLLANSGNEE